MLSKSAVRRSPGCVTTVREQDLLRAAVVRGPVPLLGPTLAGIPWYQPTLNLRSRRTAIGAVCLSGETAPIGAQTALLDGTAAVRRARAASGLQIRRDVGRPAGRVGLGLTLASYPGHTRVRWCQLRSVVAPPAASRPAAASGLG